MMLTHFGDTNFIAGIWFIRICLIDFLQQDLILVMLEDNDLFIIAYIAPEVLEGKVHTPKLDYWSLGVIAYRMVYHAVLPS